MNVRLSLGKGITGSLAYVMGQGNDPVTEQRLELGAGEKSRADILGGQNFGFEIDSADRLDLARRMMEWSAKPDNQASRGKKCVLDCLHVSLAWEKGQEPSRAEMAEAARGFLKSVGMGSARAVFVAHDDTPHQHIHIIASRIDPASCKTISDSDIRIKSQTWALHWERDHNQRSECESRQARHKIIDAIEAHDLPVIVENLTARNPTFTARELDNALAYGQLDKKERGEFKAEILAHQNIIGLREETLGPVTRYTTREILAAEIGFAARRAAFGRRSHARLERQPVAAIQRRYAETRTGRSLDASDWRARLRRLARRGRNRQIHTLKAVRAAYEAEGASCIGLSWTNEVVKQMRGDGFADAATIASALKRSRTGAATGHSNTVLIVDEAAMISTEHLAQACRRRARGRRETDPCGRRRAARQHRARRDVRDVAAVSHGAAVLKDVQRVKDAEQKAAFGEMHQDEFLGALQFAEKAGRHPLGRDAGRRLARHGGSIRRRRCGFARQAPLHVRLHQCRG